MISARHSESISKNIKIKSEYDVEDGRNWIWKEKYYWELQEHSGRCWMMEDRDRKMLRQWKCLLLLIILKKWKSIISCMKRRLKSGRKSGKVRSKSQETEV